MTFLKKTKKWFGGALLMLSQMLLMLFSKTFEDPGGGREGEVHAIVSPVLFFLPQYMMFFNIFLIVPCFFNAVSSPYVLNSTVVDYRRILHKPLS